MNASTFSTISFNITQYWSAFSKSFSTSLNPWSKAIFATSATALAGVGLHHWSQSNQLSDDLLPDNDTSNKIRERVTRTYAYVFGGFALMATSAVISHIKGLSRIILTSTSYALPIGLTCLSLGSLIATVLTSKENGKTKHVAWSVFNISMGLTLSTLGFINPVILAQAAFISLGVGGCLTLTAYLAPDDSFLKWKGPLITALTTLTIASAVSTFFPGSAFAYGVDRASLYGGLVIFSGLLMASTQQLYQEAKTQSEEQFDAINSSISISLKGLNIFMRILIILMENQKEKE